MATITQTVQFAASPHDVYEALMDSKKHSEFTGEKAVITAEVGASFSAYGDYIEGINLELVPDKKITQHWRASDWPKGHYSTARFELEQNAKGTKLTFIQTQVPEKFAKDIATGWKEFYWDKMKTYFKKK